MTVKELIERLNDFNPNDEVRIFNGMSVEYSDVGVGDAPNVVFIGCGIRGLDEIISELNDNIYDLDSALDDLQEDGVEIWDAESALDSIKLSVSDLEDLDY